jgi:hypothetical protein
VVDPLVIVDGANVVGSVPNGWWKDRAGAARRLRDSLMPIATQGLDDQEPPLEVVLVVEGEARGIAAEQPPAGVSVVAAPGSGDDTIVELTRACTGERTCVVVTADRQLRERVTALGAQVLGPRALAHLRS